LPKRKGEAKKLPFLYEKEKVGPKETFSLRGVLSLAFVCRLSYLFFAKKKREDQKKRIRFAGILSLAFLLPSSHLFFTRKKRWGQKKRSRFAYLFFAKKKR
jgi:hypothetical protein